MRIHIDMLNGVLNAKAFARLTQKLRDSLHAFADGISHVKLVLNSKPGRGKSGRQAHVRVDFKMGGHLLLQTQGQTAGEAAAFALARVKNAVQREMVRRWEWHDARLAPNR